MAASSSLAKLIVAIIIGAFGHGDQGSGAINPQQRPPAGAAASRRTFEARPTGEWVATGRVLSANGVANRSVGEVLHRRWRFETRCRGGACQTYLLRTSSTGVQSSPLRFLPHNYLAEFGNLGTTCEVRPGYFKTISVTFSIWWTKHRSQLVAEEMGGFVGGPLCRYAGERIRWTAHRRSDNRPPQRRNPALGRGPRGTATGIRTPVSAVRGRRPSPLDDSGEEAGILARPGGGLRREGGSAVEARSVNCLLPRLWRNW